MKHKIEKLLEYQLNKSICCIHNDFNINSESLHNLIRSIIVNTNIKINLRNTNLNDSDNIIKKKLIDLLNNSPDFIHLNKTLTSMTNSFITICRKDNLNTEIIDDDYVNALLIEYIENSI